MSTIGVGQCVCAGLKNEENKIEDRLIGSYSIDHITYRNKEVHQNNLQIVNQVVLEELE